MTANFEYDDAPYRERPTVGPVYTISLDLEADSLGYAYAYVDGGDERLARQRFTLTPDDGPSVAVLRWVDQILTALVNDPDGRNACGDCGNYIMMPDSHAPDCQWSRWKQRGGR